MKVRDVAANSHMRRERHTRFVGGAKQRKILMFWFQRQQRVSKRLAQPQSFARAAGCSFVQKLSRFLGAAERARAQRGIDVFGSRSDHRDLSVVDED